MTEIPDLRFSALYGRIHEIPFRKYACRSCGYVEFWTNPEVQRDRPVDFGFLQDHEKILKNIDLPSDQEIQVTFAYRNLLKRNIYDATFTVVIKSGLSLSGSQRALTARFVAGHGRIPEGPYVVVYQFNMDPEMLFVPWIVLHTPKGKRDCQIDVTFASLDFNTFAETLTIHCIPGE